MICKYPLKFLKLLPSSNRAVRRQCASVKTISFPHLDQERPSYWHIFGREPNLASHSMKIYFGLSNFVTCTKPFSYVESIFSPLKKRSMSLFLLYVIFEGIGENGSRWFLEATYAIDKYFGPQFDVELHCAFLYISPSEIS